MKYKGNTVSITITIPAHDYYRKFKAITDHAVDGYDFKVVRNLLPRDERCYTPKEFAAVVDIRGVAFKLGLMERTRVPEVIVRRTALVYLLKQKYPGRIIARALECNVSNISHTLKRYHNLQRYKDYQEAVLEISQHLTRCSLVDCSPEKP